MQNCRFSQSATIFTVRSEIPASEPDRHTVHKLAPLFEPLFAHSACMSYSFAHHIITSMLALMNSSIRPCFQLVAIYAFIMKLSLKQTHPSASCSAYRLPPNSKILPPRNCHMTQYLPYFYNSSTQPHPDSNPIPHRSRALSCGLARRHRFRWRCCGRRAPDEFLAGVGGCCRGPFWLISAGVGLWSKD